MREKTFWQLLGEILAFGDFIIAVTNNGASANIVGKISVGKDGGEIVIEKNSCHCHVHLQPEKVVRFSFIYKNAGYGDEPCCELLTPQDETVVRLYYRGADAGEKFSFFQSKHPENTDLIKGIW